MNDLRAEWTDFRVPNTVSNLAFPLVAALALMLPPATWLDSIFVVVMSILALGSALWHWKGIHPYNVADRIGMYLVFSFLGGVAYGLPALGIAIFAGAWGLYRLTSNSNFVVGLLAFLAWIPLGARAMTGGPWLDGAAVLGLYLAVLASAELDRHHNEPHRRGAAHPFWHVGAAVAITLHYQLLLG